MDEAPGRRAAPLTVVTVVFAVGAVLMGLLAAWLLTRPDPQPPIRITGVISVIDEGYAGDDAACTREVGRGQMAGEQLTVTGPDGELLGSTTIGPGQRSALFECRFRYAVDDLDEVDEYTVAIPGVGISEVVTSEQLKIDGFVVPIAVGGLAG